MPTAPTPAVRRLVAFLASATTRGDDPLRDVRLARDWCRAQGLDPGRRPFTPADLSHLRTLRAALRASLDDPTGGAARRIGGPARRARLGVVLGADGPVVASAGTGADAVIGRLLLDAVEAATIGAWARIRTCAAAGCPAVFIDTSRSGTRTWCDMATCGNRAKVRAHRVRTRAPVGAVR